MSERIKAAIAKIKEGHALAKIGMEELENAMSGKTVESVDVAVPVYREMTEL